MGAAERLSGRSAQSLRPPSMTAKRGLGRTGATSTPAITAVPGEGAVLAPAAEGEGDPDPPLVEHHLGAVAPHHQVEPDHRLLGEVVGELGAGRSRGPR